LYFPFFYGLIACRIASVRVPESAKPSTTSTSEAQVAIQPLDSAAGSLSIPTTGFTSIPTTGFTSTFAAVKPSSAELEETFAAPWPVLSSAELARGSKQDQHQRWRRRRRHGDGENGGSRLGGRCTRTSL
jgi:hypothetical protein